MTLDLRWDEAVVLGNEQGDYVVVPIVESLMVFDGVYKGHRRLVINKQGGEVTGRIVELLLKGTERSPGEVNLLCRDVYQSHITGNWYSGGNVNGLVAFYNKDNLFIAGKNYVDGIASEDAWINFVLDSESPYGTQQRLSCYKVVLHLTTSSTDELVVMVCYIYSDGPGGVSGPGTGSNPGGPNPGGYPHGNGPGTGVGANGHQPTSTGGAGYGGNNPNVLVDPVSLVNTTQVPTCIQPIVNSIRSTNTTFNSSMETYFGFTRIGTTISVVDIADHIYPNGTTGPVNGNTIRSGVVPNRPTINNYNIKLNERMIKGVGDSSISGRAKGTDLAIAATLLHELLHACVIEWNRNNGGNLDENSPVGMMLQGYSVISENDQNAQHQVMSDMVAILAQALYAYNNNIVPGRQVSLTYCENLIWTGMIGTSAYNALPQQRRNEINLVNTLENLGFRVNNGYDAQGNTIYRYPLGNKSSCR
jgi:hypothetical protein